MANVHALPASVPPCAAGADASVVKSAGRALQILEYFDSVPARGLCHGNIAGASVSAVEHIGAAAKPGPSRLPSERPLSPHLFSDAPSALVGQLGRSCHRPSGRAAYACRRTRGPHGADDRYRDDQRLAGAIYLCEPAGEGARWFRCFSCRRALPARAHRARQGAARRSWRQACVSSSSGALTASGRSMSRLSRRPNSLPNWSVAASSAGLSAEGPTVRYIPASRSVHRSQAATAVDRNRIKGFDIGEQCTELRSELLAIWQWKPQA